MSYPRSRTEVFDGLRIEASSFKTNLWVYRSIGGQVVVKGGKADEIRLENTYYSTFQGTPIVVTVAKHEKYFRAVSKCELKHWAVGVGVKLKFPGGDVRPAGVPDLLPLEGVISKATIRINRAANYTYNGDWTAPRGVALGPRTCCHRSSYSGEHRAVSM